MFAVAVGGAQLGSDELSHLPECEFTGREGIVQLHAIAIGKSDEQLHLGDGIKFRLEKVASGASLCGGIRKSFVRNAVM